MSFQKFFQFFLILGTALLMLALFQFFQGGNGAIEGGQHYNLLSQNTNTYLGPNQKVPANSDFVRVQILLYNDPDPKGVTIRSATFDGTEIPLKPRDIYGFRGQASFQKRGGKYLLKWVVDRNQGDWPRTVEHEEEVILSPLDLWIQIAIVGGNAEIS